MVILLFFSLLLALMSVSVMAPSYLYADFIKLSSGRFKATNWKQIDHKNTRMFSLYFISNFSYFPFWFLQQDFALIIPDPTHC